MKSHLRLLIPVFALSLVSCTTPQTPRTPQQAANKAIVLRSESELWSNGTLSVIEELYSPDFICHFPVGPEWRGHEGIRSAVSGHRASFPDWNERVDDIVAEGDRVVIRFTSTGTHLGEFEGLAPTGRKVSIQEVAIFRFVDGKIVEQWGMPDIQGLMQQLGSTNLAMPPAQ